MIYACGATYLVMNIGATWIVMRANWQECAETIKKEMGNIESVDEVITFSDDDAGSCINALEKIKDKYPDETIIFCNGGDRTNKNIPEMIVKDIEFKFGVGGNDKKNSSSWLLKNWNYGSENRVWGNFYNL